MVQRETTLGQLEYRLVLLNSGSHTTWAAREGHDLRLPRIAIPRWTRPALEIQRAIERRWGHRAIVLDVLSYAGNSNCCAIVEVPSTDRHNNLEAVGVDALAEGELAPDEKQVVEAILTGKSGDRGPFSRLGWTDEAQNWIQRETGRDIVFTGEIRQYNASGRFQLARFATHGGPGYWLKATGEPNMHEFQITKLLAALCPEYLPRRIAERADWNAWLMEDAGSPTDSWTLRRLETALISIAALQKRTIGRTNLFLDAGVFDQRLCTLRAHLDELIDYLGEAMTEQVSTRVPRIDMRRLLGLKEILREASLCMEALEIPDTLVHNDLNSGNILFRESQCAFTDWSEAGIGNPFFAFEYLCLVDRIGQEAWRTSLRQVYKRSWLDRITSSHVDKALILTPLLAILSYLYGRGSWLRSSRRNDPHIAMHARSLARRMDRASRDSLLMEALRH